MTRRRRSFIALSIVAVLAGGLSTARSASALVGPFHTVGNQILDANNQPVRFRGVTAGILQVYPYLPSGNSLSASSVAAMKTWGVNAVRIPISEQYWFQSWGCRYQISPSAYQDNVALAVSRVTSQGMLAIIDLHFNTKQNTGWCGSGQQPMADYPRAITLWQQAATRFKGNPLVAFDLYNEPHDISWELWRNGGAIVDYSGYWRAAGMQQMYDAVRSAGAQNLVFVSGNSWADVPPSSSMLLNGYNIVYAGHYYTCPTQPPPLGNCNTDPYNPAPAGQRLDAWTPLSLTQPVTVTEFGWPDDKNGTYNQNVITWAESHSISWLAFIWNPDPRFGIVTDVYSFNPTPSGIPVKNGVALNL